jgi:hypothetical protein
MINAIWPKDVRSARQPSLLFYQVTTLGNISFSNPVQINQGFTFEDKTTEKGCSIFMVSPGIPVRAEIFGP